MQKICIYPTKNLNDKILDLPYTVFTVDKEIDMTAREHLKDLALRYAEALLQYRRTESRDDLDVAAELHNTMDDICQELALEEEA
jgi:uncharacterized protein (DUF1015 family)